MSITAALTLSPDSAAAGQPVTATLVITNDSTQETVRSIDPVAFTAVSESPVTLSEVSFNSEIEEALTATVTVTKSGGWGEAEVLLDDGVSPFSQVVPRDGILNITSTSKEAWAELVYGSYLEVGMACDVDITAYDPLGPTPGTITLTNTGSVVSASVPVVQGQPDYVDLVVPTSSTLTKKYGVVAWGPDAGETQKYDIGANIVMSDGTLVVASTDELTVTGKVV